VERANLQPGQKVLIHAGSGGVGTIAIQLAKHLGASVATTTSTANIDLVRGLGADVVVDYKKQAFETILHDQEVVLDTLGGETLDKSFQVLKSGRKVISIKMYALSTKLFTANEIKLNWMIVRSSKSVSANSILRWFMVISVTPLKIHRSKRYRSRYNHPTVSGGSSMYPDLASLAALSESY
jgi:NADPH:quinone reductase-like Zn-dependent oxidoreductase